MDGEDFAGVIGFDTPNGTINISTNGFHEYTIINDKVFDNNVFNGMPVDEYLSKLVDQFGFGHRDIEIVD